MRFSGKSVVVTGAGSGIGRSMAQLFAREGAHVYALDVVEKGLAKAQKRWSSEGLEIQTRVIDVTDKDAMCGLLDEVVATHERLDVLCNNAGILDKLLGAAACPDEVWEKVMAVNVTGPFQACRHAIPIMIAQGGGAIVNTSSAAGTHGGRGGAAYTASKHALIGLTRNIAWYYGPQKIRCNAIAPGAVMTPMGTTPPDEEAMKRFMPYFPVIPPHGKAKEIAHAALFLASADASYVNGAVLAVDGTWTTY